MTEFSIMTSNLFANLPSNLPDELFTTLLEATNLRIERIISHGHSSPEGFWYDQDQHEWVIVLQGAARLSIEGELKELKPGDHINLAAHQKHRVMGRSRCNSETSGSITRFGIEWFNALFETWRAISHQTPRLHVVDESKPVVPVLRSTWHLQLPVI
jgi:cupin 2 domain-containing protein